MSKTAISVRGLTKEYQILHNVERHDRVTEAVASSVKGLFLKKDVETFRALDDVSFDVQEGEVLGVIGRNGAGKSTLLKVLSRITEPTAGEVRLYGRVGSLLEVGTGFHPELTGRENIYLNGAILGMRRKEIDRQFDAIVDFAEVEKFLDTPVKRYSSGMYVRLAFAVAAHLNPEILIVDEVLAVGDAQFQKKCLGKMQDVSRQEGRTVLFVSHNMAVLRELCVHAIELANGRVVSYGNASSVVSSYLGKDLLSNPDSQHSAKGYTLEQIGIFDPCGGDSLRTVEPYADYRLRVTLSFTQTEPKLGLAIYLFNEQQILVSCICNPEEGLGWFQAETKVAIEYSLPHLSLTPGRYTTNLILFGAKGPVELKNVLEFEVEPKVAPGAAVAYSSQHGVYRIANGGRVVADSPAVTLAKPKRHAP